MNILETAAQTHSPFLHPGGETLTHLLIQTLDLQPGQRVLEIGCGTGATSARLAETSHAQIITFDQMPSMLEATAIRFRRSRLSSVFLLAANANSPLPFKSAIFDAVYAESVLALTHVPLVIKDIARVLRPGGQLVLNERIWKSNITREETAQINSMSQNYFGIPAATPEPWDKHDWLDLLQTAGFESVTITPVASLIPPNHQRQIRLFQRLTHLNHHLRHPLTYFNNLRFRYISKRYAKIWAKMEAILFTGRLKNG